MKRLMFLITARSGSSFLRHLLSPGQSVKRLAETTPQATYYPEDFNPGKDLVVTHISRLGKITQPEVYSLYAPVASNLDFYNETYFPDKENWRFVYILRDPRSRIASYLNWGDNKYKSAEEHNEIIYREIQNFKTIAPALLEMKEDTRFKLVPFENFIASPLDELESMFRFGDLQLKTDIYKSRIALYKNNSSFLEKGKGSVSRKVILTDEQFSLIEDLAGPELLSLGYTLKS